MQNRIEVLNKVKNTNNLKSTTANGAIIVRTPVGNTMKFIKELLSTNLATGMNEGIEYSNSNKFKIYPNPVNEFSQIQFTLDKPSKVSIQIVDLNGRIISNIATDNYLDSGNHSYNLNLTNDNSVYLVKLIINDNVNVRKIIVNK